MNSTKKKLTKKQKREKKSQKKNIIIIVIIIRITKIIPIPKSTTNIHKHLFKTT